MPWQLAGAIQATNQLEKDKEQNYLYPCCGEHSLNRYEKVVGDKKKKLLMFYLIPILVTY